MIKRIIIKLDTVEAMLYFWQATKDREKVGEKYLQDLSDFSDMKFIYDNEFNKESVRSVLSAISNREVLNSESKKERKYWNNNMWMLEDLGYTHMMVAPLKTLNLDGLIDQLNSRVDSKYEEVEVIFLPGHVDEFSISENKLIINFFRVKPDLYEDGKITINDQPLISFIEEKLLMLMNAN